MRVTSSSAACSPSAGCAECSRAGGALAGDSCAALAAADEPAPPEPDVTVYGFDEDQVLGDKVRPRPRRELLVRARDRYVRELLSSVEAL